MNPEHTIGEPEKRSAQQSRENIFAEYIRFCFFFLFMCVC